MENTVGFDSAYRSILFKRIPRWIAGGMFAGVFILFLLLFYLVFTHVKPLTTKLIWDVVVASGSGAFVGAFFGGVFGYLTIAFPLGFAKSEDRRWRILLRAEGHDDEDLE